MNKYEFLACNQVFLSYPTDKSFDFIVMLCKADNARETFNSAFANHLDGHQRLILSDSYADESWQNIPAILNQLIKDAKQKHPGLENETFAQKISYFANPLGQNT